MIQHISYMISYHTSFFLCWSCFWLLWTSFDVSIKLTPIEPRTQILGYQMSIFANKVLQKG